MLRLLLTLLALAAPAFAEDAIGRVNIGGYNTRGMCTGTLVRPDLVLTAAHCVADRGDGLVKRLADMVFVAGWKGGDHAGAAKAASVTLHPLAHAEGRFVTQHDVAVIRLETPLAVPPIALGEAPPEGPFRFIGYRRDHPHRQIVETGCAGFDFGAVWRITCDARTGQSGSPVLYGEGADARLVAVVVARSAAGAVVVPIDDWMRSRLAEDR